MQFAMPRKGLFLWVILFRIIDGSEAKIGVGQLRRRGVGKMKNLFITVT